MILHSWVWQFTSLAVTLPQIKFIGKDNSLLISMPVSTSMSWFSCRCWRFFKSGILYKEIFSYSIHCSRSHWIVGTDNNTPTFCRLLRWSCAVCHCYLNGLFITQCWNSILLSTSEFPTCLIFLCPHFHYCLCNALYTSCCCMLRKNNPLQNL